MDVNTVNEVAIHTAGRVNSHFGAADHTAGRVYIRTFFAYTHGPPCGQWHRHAGKSSKSVQCAITGPRLRMCHRPSA